MISSLKLTVSACALSADSKPYEVRRGSIDIDALTDLKPAKQTGRLINPIGYVSGLATTWLPEDVAEKNRKKLQGFTGKRQVSRVEAKSDS